MSKITSDALKEEIKNAFIEIDERLCKGGFDKNAGADELDVDVFKGCPFKDNAEREEARKSLALLLEKLDA